MNFYREHSGNFIFYKHLIFNEIKILSMKHILLLIAVLGIGAASLQAQDRGLYWKYKDYDGAITVSLPEFAIEMGSWFVQDDGTRDVISKINHVRVLVFTEGNNPIRAKDMRKFHKKARRRHLEELMAIRDGSTRVSILGKDRRSILKKVVVLVNTPDEFVLVSVRGRLDLSNISGLVNTYTKKGQKKEGISAPDIIKIPTKKT
jgi:hypothetical protein